MLRKTLYILLSPVMFIFRLIILIGVVLNALSTGLLSIVSSIFGILAVLMILTGGQQNGAILLVAAFLISPIGLPLLAEKLLFFVDGLGGDLMAWLRA